MAAFFALGSTCFLIGPFPGYAQLVGAQADAATFFIGSILFTAGGALQTLIALPERDSGAAGRAAFRAAVIQSAGTLFFNVTTFRALDTALSNPDYNSLVWRPDAFGSICFLVSGVIAYRAASPRWWQPGVNLLGCVFFGISAVAGYVVPSKGSMLDLAAANWNTALGAACFLACALAGLRASAAVPQATGSVSTNATPPASSANAMHTTATRSGHQSSRSEIPAKNSTAAKNTVDKT